MGSASSGLIPPPANAVELERESTISLQQSSSFVGLTSDADGNIYVSLWSVGIVQKYSAQGEPLLTLGRKPNGKPFLREPLEVRASSGLLAVHDLGRASIEVFDQSGTRVRGRKVSECDDFALGDGGRLFVAQAVQDLSTPLVSVLGPDGESSAFGKPLPFPHSLRVLNSRTLALNDKGGIFVAFTYFPIIREYSADSALKAEYRLESAVIKAKEDYNLKLIGEGIADPSKRAGFRAVTLRAKSLGEKVYLLSVWPRLEITEVDDQGRQGVTYWQDRFEISDDRDFAVVRVGNDLKFYVAHPSPQGTDIDVFRKKVRREGPQAEIDELSDEILAYPENPLNSINRGVAKHRQGDYLGAIKDFSRAIELDPGSPLAINNRGAFSIEDRRFDRRHQRFHQGRRTCARGCNGLLQPGHRSRPKLGVCQGDQGFRKGRAPGPQDEGQIPGADRILPEPPEIHREVVLSGGREGRLKIRGRRGPRTCRPTPSTGAWPSGRNPRCSPSGTRSRPRPLPRPT
jgi:hypothetical protein